MVGKIKRVRQKLHHDAVKINPGKEKTSLSLETNVEKTPRLPLNITTKPETRKKPRDLKAFNFPKGVFAGTVIPPEALVQTLSVSEPPAEPTAKQTAEPTAEQPRGVGEKKQQSKKEKMKERRERWLNSFNPIWNDTLNFTVHVPELALVRFMVEDYDKTSKNDFVGQYTLPFSCIQQGYRHIHLLSKDGTSIPPSSLFVHIRIKEAT
ncbi:hypothetical protein PHYPO_G00149050 [Pangasianodon hypophthalmus]|uniref:C2 domain-containing protein n=1 Tax=Pangasianodon hypophthalmus TaxID=310915 RepID=A0A5N5K3Z8_PANHP|nr:hypothetical protein PHYPO_G00149050 [Pangasianodon hypophthalmus]